MPITSSIDNDRDLTTFTVKGVLTFNEVMFFIQSFYDGNPTKHVLWDLLEITENQLTMEQMEKVVSFQPRFEGRRKFGKTALLLRDKVLYREARALAMQSNLLKSPYVVMVFGSKETAYKWFDEP